MPSNEEYLDKLLKDLIENIDQIEVPEEDADLSDDIVVESGVTESDTLESGVTESDTLKSDVMESGAVETDVSETALDMSDMDALLSFGMDEEEDYSTAMSEEEIDQILKSNRMEETKTEDEGNLSDADDLMNLLEGTSEDSSDLQDIHDLLQKSDNNEAVDEASIAKMQEVPDVVGDGVAGEMAELLGESEENPEAELTERQKKALEKKRLREEKAVARKAAKEAKKAEKLAKKAAKKNKPLEMEEADDANAAEAMATDPGDEGAESVIGDTDAAIPETDTGEDILLDADLLGSDPFMDQQELPAEDEDSGEDAKEDAETAEDDQEDGVEQQDKPRRGLLTMLLNFLTEEDEDEEESERGTEDIPLSDENRQVLEEMDQEKPGKKGKGKSKKSKKKDKKSGGETADGEDEESEDGKKEKKVKKPKKEKPPKEKTPVDPKKKITLKKLMPIILAGVSLLLVIMLYVNVGSDLIGKEQARKAFYEEDYETCYQELYGRKLNETELVMFGKSESILRIRLWMREYELFVDESAEVAALDVLIQSVNDYADLYDYANRWNAGGEVSDVYGQMLVILRDKYGLTEAQALEIAAEPDDVEYTKLVTAVAQGKGYTSHAEESVQAPVELPDMLPEEKQFPENNGGR